MRSRQPGEPIGKGGRVGPAPFRLALSFLVATLLIPPSIWAGITGRGADRLPPLLFVSRNRPADPAQVPGLGPAGRNLSPGGALLKREPSGRIHPLLPGNALFDVSDPAVSWDGRWVAFSGKVHPDSAWRLWICDAGGRGLRALTGAGNGEPERAAGGERDRITRQDGDDFDPCWLPDGRIVFASTRYALQSLAGPFPVTNLFSVHADGTGLARITVDRNGAEEPTVDARAGRIVYARWWFNPWRPSDQDPGGVTRDPSRSVAPNEIDFWHAISVLPDGDGIRLAGGDPRLRDGVSLYQPVILPDGTLVGISADNPSLLPSPGLTRLVSFSGGLNEPRYLTSGGRAAAPAGLSDGRLVFAWEPAGTGEMDLYVLSPEDQEPRRAGGDHQPRRLGGLAGRLDLDPVPLVARKAPAFPAPLLPPPALTSTFTLDDVHTVDRTFRFDCLNVFTNGPVDSPLPDAPPLAPDVRIRFFTVLPRLATQGGDTLILVREAPLTSEGAVHEHELPADIPMFEQLIDRQGHILRSTHGPAHVPGFNFARMGSGTKCVGCHTGHSTLPAPKNNEEARWFNAAPSAEVKASSILPGTAGPRAAVDRRTRGPFDEVGWTAGQLAGQRLELAWSVPLVARRIVLYAPRDEKESGTRLRISGATLVFFRSGREVGRREMEGQEPLSADGTAITFNPLTCDRISIELSQLSGRLRDQEVAGLAEVEVEARLADD